MAKDQAEWLKCYHSFAYFVDTYIYIYDATLGEWVRFRLWDAQMSVADDFEQNRLVIVLKARQLGITWLALAYALWLMLFHPIATVLAFSRREKEAIQLLERARNMYQRLPEFMQARSLVTDNTVAFELSNGSVMFGFPTTAGDSYTASLVIVDEADLVPDLTALLGAVKPTIDGGGRMLLVSRVDKKTPTSPFKNIYRGAMSGSNTWKAVFLPWWSRPSRDKAWYQAIKDEILSRTGALDELHEQYPETPEEALAPAQLDKRIPFQWVQKAYKERFPVQSELNLPYLRVFKEVEFGVSYVIGADPAEGNPTSDPSAACILDARTGEEVATLWGRIEPDIFGGYLCDISEYFNKALMMVERNNHGHTVIKTIKDAGLDNRLLKGLDKKVGWHTNTKSKAVMYTVAAESLRDLQARVSYSETYSQLTSIEGATLKAPEGLEDDLATAFALATLAKKGQAGIMFALQYMEKMYAKKSNGDNRLRRLGLLGGSYRVTRRS